MNLEIGTEEIKNKKAINIDKRELFKSHNLYKLFSTTFIFELINTYNILYTMQTAYFDVSSFVHSVLEFVNTLFQSPANPETFFQSFIQFPIFHTTYQ